MSQAPTLTWQVGDVIISRVLEVVLEVEYYEKYPFMAAARPAALQEIPWLYPNFVTPEGHLLLSIHALLVQTPDINLLVDTCVGNDKPRKITANEALHTEFLKDLGAAGCDHLAIDLVVCTYLHVDHVGWNTMKAGNRWQPTFPNARYLLGSEEYEFWAGSDAEDQLPVMEDSVAPLFAAGLVDLVETDHRISDEIRLLPTTGHTPGHVSVLIESRGEKAMITGDMMHHPCQIARPDWTVAFDEDQNAAAACRHAVLKELVDSPTLVIGTHFAAPSAGKVVSDGDSYRFVY
ncbi:MAG: MBL fold metallo-hydrolase [Proteobacteria bacterium]|nr:MBL fold metallo-hydrolase [Pseudomonadota bacterium]